MFSLTIIFPQVIGRTGGWLYAGKKRKERMIFFFNSVNCPQSVIFPRVATLPARTYFSLSCLIPPNSVLVYFMSGSLPQTQTVLGQCVKQ